MARTSASTARSGWRHDEPIGAPGAGELAIARPEAWRLDPAAYPYHDTVQTRFQDLDVLGHINNVAMGALFESARTRFNQAIGLDRWRTYRWLIANVEINYLAEGQVPADVEIGTGVGRIGSRSWTLFALALQNGKPIATCDVVIVFEAEAMPEEFRVLLGEWMVRTR